MDDSGRRRIRAVLGTLGALAVAGALLPGWRFEGGATRTRAQADFLLANPEVRPGRTTFRLGWPSSPLFDYRDETTLDEGTRGAVTLRRASGGRLEWRSWSALAMVGGLVLIRWARRG